MAREIGAKATSNAFSVNEPDEGALMTNDPSGPEDEASSVRPCSSCSVTTTPGSGWRDAVTEPWTVQAEGACAPGMTGRSTAHVRHDPYVIARHTRIRRIDATATLRIRGSGRIKV
jgi:hypothetical protein